MTNSEIFVNAALMPVIAFFAYLWSDRGNRMEWAKFSSVKAVVLEMSVLVVCLPTGALALASMVFRFSPESGSLPANNNMEATILILARAFVIPVCEEVIFRGYLLDRLQRSGRHWLSATLMLSAIFTMIHPPIMWLPVFAFSLWACSARLLTGSLVPGLIVHVAFNMFGPFFQTAGGEAYLESAILNSFPVFVGAVIIGLVVHSLIWFVISRSFRRVNESRPHVE